MRGVASTNRGPIAVLGATGFTGRLVVHELAALKRPLRLVARSTEALESLKRQLGDVEIAQAEASNPEALRAALRGASVAISTIGPFTTHGSPVVRAAIESGCHYLDTTGEQGFIHKVASKYGPEAAARGVAVVPACAYEYAVGDGAAALAAKGLGALDSIEVTYHWSNAEMSRGTRLSAVEILIEGGAELQDGRFVPIRPGAVREVRFQDKPRKAIAWAGGECIMAPNYLSVRSVSTWLTMPPKLLWGIPVVTKLAQFAPGLARRLAGRGARGPEEPSRRHATFAVLASARGPAGVRNVTVAGRDPYGLTGAIIAHCAARLADGIGKKGYLAPSQVIEPGELFGALAQRFELRILGAER